MKREGRSFGTEATRGAADGSDGRGRLHAERAEGAVCYLRESGGYVAVFETGRSREPLRVTRIELKCLRAADRAMVEAGIPVLSRQELLQLLEDLGS